MPRRNAAQKRQILPDPVYHSELVMKFINVVMRRGKKSVAEQIVYESLAHVVEETRKDKSGANKKPAANNPAESANIAHPEGVKVLEDVLNNIRPTVEVKSRRVGGATYQVPMEVAPLRGLALAMRMLTKAAKGRNEKTMVLRLRAEMLDALKNRGAAVKERDDIHRMAEANQAFAHYRW